MIERTITDVVLTIETGEFYQDYDQSSADLRVLRATVNRIAELEAEVERLKLSCSAWEDSARINKARADAAEALSRTGVDPRHFNILADAMAEVKATSDGLSDQPIADIVQGCIDEISALEPATPQEAPALMQVGWAYQDKKWDADRWHVCGWEKPREHEGRKVKPIYIAEPAAPEGQQDDGYNDADGYPCECTRPVERAVTEALNRIRDYADKPHADRYVIRHMAEGAIKAAMEAGR